MEIIIVFAIVFTFITGVITIGNKIVDFISFMGDEYKAYKKGKEDKKYLEEMKRLMKEAGY